MQRISLVLAGLLSIAACGEDVPVGEQPNDGDDAAGDGDGDGDTPGDGDGDGDGDNGDDGSDDDGDAGTDDPATDPIDDAIGYTEGDIACQEDADCCVVIDQCRGIGLVVSDADLQTVRGLVDSAGQTECVTCVATVVQVTCEQGLCVGRTVPPGPGGIAQNGWAVDHCGNNQTASGASEETGHVLGCGAGALGD
jgi:hypothetical protein